MKNIGLIRIFDDHDKWISSIVSRFFSILRNISSSSNTLCIAVSGGTTPYPIYEAIRDAILSDNDLYLLASKLHVFVVDERILPFHHSESNGGRIQKIWDKLPMHLHFIDFWQGEEELLNIYKCNISKTVKFNDVGFPVFDLVLLGLGNDGHIASLFPNSEALYNKLDFITFNSVADKFPKRITLTFPTLKAATHIIILFRGVEKLTIMTKLLIENKTDFPIEQILLDESKFPEWFISKY